MRLGHTANTVIGVQNQNRTESVRRVEPVGTTDGRVGDRDRMNGK